MINSTIDANPIEQKRLYEFLSEMGLLTSPQGAIEYYRKHYPMYQKMDLSSADILGVGYWGQHFQVKPEYKDCLEIWIDDIYIRPDECDYIVANPYQCFVILPKVYPEGAVCKCFINPDLLFRYHKIENNNDFKMYVTEIDISDYLYSNIDITNSVFYISHDHVHIPTITKKGETTYEIRAPYQRDIDLFICSNLARVVECNRWYRELITSPTSNKLYCSIIVDHDDDSNIDARYYPAVLARGIMRVYKTGCREYKYPLGAYLINYPEFINVRDPYHPYADEVSEELYQFLRTYHAATYRDIITEEDSVKTMYDKLSRICAGCYNVCEILPPNYEPANFLICDNSNKNYPTFITDTIDRKPVIRSTVPKETFREILLYGQCPFDKDYSTCKIGDKEYYVFSPDYDPDQFTLIKFNAAEDTHLMNANEYLIKDNFLNLHYKLNRFYRNLMILRMQEFDKEWTLDEQVYVGTTKPPMDEHMWFEFILNMDPERFEKDIVKIYLNEDEIPEPIREGMYALDIPSDGGMTEYSTLMDTYFKLTKYYRKFLVLDHEPKQNNPEEEIHDTIQLGNLEKNPGLRPINGDPNELLIDSQEYENKGRRNFYYSNEYEVPFIPYAVENDLFIKYCGLAGVEIPNDKVTKIEFGEHEPSEDSFNTLWVDSEYLSSDDLFTGLVNAVQNNITVSNIDNPNKGMYALDPIGDTGFPETSPTSPKQKESLGRMLSDSVSSMSRKIKADLVMMYLTTNMMSDTAKKKWWKDYLDSVDDDTLNEITEKLIMTKSLFDAVEPYGTMAFETPEGPDYEITDLQIGHTTKGIDKVGTMLLRDFIVNPDGTLNPDDMDVARRRAVQYILSLREPDDAVAGRLWLNLKPVSFDDIIEDVLSAVILECGSELPENPIPGMEFSNDSAAYETTAILDFGAHGGENEVRSMQGVETTLHPVHNGGEISIDSVEENDIWFEWLDKVAPAVCYSAPDAYVLRVDDHLYGVEFGENEYIDIFAFDDIVLHFGEYDRRTKYLAILADLMEAKIVHPNDVAIFSHRLMTCRDHVDPHLKRLVGRESNVISTLKTNWKSFSIMFSMNIGRFTMDYRTAGDREQENAWKMIIDLRKRNFAYLSGRMIVFVNGKYIRAEDISEPAAHLMQLHNFHEVIACVDIFYYKRDSHLIDIKRIAADCWPEADLGHFVDPKTLSEMEFVEEYDKTYKGYYDVLWREYIESGYLLTRLKEIIGNPEMEADFKEEMLHKFQDITDKKIFEFGGQNRIVLSGENHGRASYEIR